MCSVAKQRSEYPANTLNNSDFFNEVHNDVNNDYNFRYVPVNRFKNIERDVKKQRKKDEEERAYSAFFEEKRKLANKHDCGENKYKSTRSLTETFQDIDRELLRLNVDGVPERQSRFDTRKLEHSQRRVQSAKHTGIASVSSAPPGESSCYITESSGSLENRAAYIRKSSSDQMLKKKQDLSRCCNHSYNEFDYNSSPEISPSRFSNDYEEYDNDMPVNPDPVIVKKIFNLQKKISCVLNDISFEIVRIPLPDGIDDLHRRKQRVLEFSTRLSRNYLYDLGRQITDIQRHIRAIYPNFRSRMCRSGAILHMQAMEQKLLSAHQLLLAALTAYCKHIPCSVLRSNSGKLKELLQIVVELKNICHDIKLTPEQYSSGDEKDTFLGKETEIRCATILNKCRAASEYGSQVTSHATKSTTAASSKNKNQRNRKLANRFSMYTADLRWGKSFQPKKTRSMSQITRSKKQQCATCKQRQSNPSIVLRKIIPPQGKAASKATGKRDKILKVPVKEDEIHTVVENVSDDLDLDGLQSLKSGKEKENKKEAFKNKLSNFEHESNVKSEKFYQNKVDRKKLNEDENSKEQLVNYWLPAVKHLLTAVENKEVNAEAIPADLIEKLYAMLAQDQTKGDTNDSSNEEEIVVGSKNLKLFSCASKEDNSWKIKTIDRKVENQMIETKDAPCQAIYFENIGDFKLKISDKAIHNLADYKKKLGENIKDNSMYSSKDIKNKPWDIVAWIADRLVEELIVEISDDFQIDDMIEKLVDLEFQEF